MYEKVTLKDLEREIIKETIEVGEINGKKIIFNPNISCEKAFSFCERTANNILSSDRTYLPELENILIFYFMTKSMTNLTFRLRKKPKRSIMGID